jgi:hypothetical protein
VNASANANVHESVSVSVSVSVNLRPRWVWPKVNVNESGSVNAGEMQCEGWAVDVDDDGVVVVRYAGSETWAQRCAMK